MAVWAPASLAAPDTMTLHMSACTVSTDAAGTCGDPLYTNASCDQVTVTGLCWTVRLPSTVVMK